MRILTDKAIDELMAGLAKFDAELAALREVAGAARVVGQTYLTELPRGDGFIVQPGDMQRLADALDTLDGKDKDL